MSLRSRLLKAGAWTSGAYSIEQATRLLSNLVLSRLLFPEAFGLVAASTSLLIGLMLVSDFGVRAAIIQNPRGDTDSFLRSAWVFQLSRGIVLWLVLIVCCGFLSLPFVHVLIPAQSAFSNSQFPLLTIVLGFGLVLSGLESTAIALNMRRLNYKPVILLDLVSRLVPVPIMIGFAWYTSSVWALALGGLSGGLLRVALSHLVVPGPRMMWNWKTSEIREIVHFGKWITISSIATFFSSQSDVIFFGLLFPSPFVGVYFIARTLVDAAEGLLEKLNGTLTLPVLGEVLRQNPDNLRNRFYRFRAPIDIVALGCGGFLFEAGSQVINILYDERYADAGPILEILALGLAIYPFQLIRGAFTAIGKTQTVAMVSIVQAVSMIILLFIGYSIDGALGAVAGVALSRIVPSAIISLLAHNRSWISGWQELRTIPMFVLGMLAGKLFLTLVNSFWITGHAV